MADSEQTMVFAHADSILWPAKCPNCMYSLRELPEPRCPECGERVEPGEVVLVGVPGSSSERQRQDFSLGGFLLTLGGALGVLVLIELAHLGFRETTFLQAGAVGLFMIPILGIVALVNNSMPSPPGVLVLSANGYRRGSGPRKGRWHRWSKNYRVELLSSRTPPRIRCFRCWGIVLAVTAFDLYLPYNAEQIQAIHERLKSWSGGQSRFRTKGI